MGKENVGDAQVRHALVEATLGELVGDLERFMKAACDRDVAVPLSLAVPAIALRASLARANEVLDRRP